VFRREGDSWNEHPETQLTASDLSPMFALFGWSLAFEGDTLLVGAPMFMANSVYVFSPDGANWPLEEAKLTASDADANDMFGFSVAISGARAVVGAPRDESTVGSAYVFDFDGADWLETAKLTASDKADYDDFGFSVAIDQDTVVVGARKNYIFVPSPGAAYVFSFDGKSWLEQAKLTANEPADYDQFGFSVAIKGSILLVGAPFVFEPDYNPGSEPGTAYVFETDGNTWSPKAKLTAAEDAQEPPDKDQFGLVVAINGTNLVVGAIDADAEMPDAGAVYVYETNEPPVAVASWDPEEGIVEGDLVNLLGSDSYDPDGDSKKLKYRWKQIGIENGAPKVDLDDFTAPVTSFHAPELSEGCAELSFQLIVIDEKGLASEPKEVEINVSPNNEIHAKLGGKHRHWLYWHKYSFYGHEADNVTIRLEADQDGWHRGSKATLILKDNIKHTRLLKTKRGSLPLEISTPLPADGKYTIYVLKQPWFWSWWRQTRFEGDYLLSLEGICGKLVNASKCNKR
jgi:hypothetical protein